MYLDLHNIPENTDYQSLYWKLVDEHHAALLEIVDLKAALNKSNPETNPKTECGVEWMDLEFCCLEKGHAGYHKTLSGQLFG